MFLWLYWESVGQSACKQLWVEADISLLEEMASSHDVEVQNLLQVTVLEYLRSSFQRESQAQSLMGPETMRLFALVKQYLDEPRRDDILYFTTQGILYQEKIPWRSHDRKRVLIVLLHNWCKSFAPQGHSQNEGWVLETSVQSTHPSLDFARWPPLCRQ